MSSIDLLSAKTPEEFFNMLAILESNEADEELEIDLLLNNLGPLPKLERQNNLAPGQRYMTDEEIEEELSKSAVDFSLLQIPKLERQNNLAPGQRYMTDEEIEEELSKSAVDFSLLQIPKLERQNNLAPGQRYMTDEEIEEELSKSSVDFSLLQIPKLQRQPSSRQTFSAEQCECDFKEFEFTPNKVLEEADDFESIFKNISLEYCKKCVSFICDCKLYN